MKTAAFKFGPGRFVAGLLLLFTGLGVATTVQAQGTGYWHTSGDLLLDANNARVRIAGINWYGFETSTAVPHGLMAQDYKTILQTIKSNGYNTVRLPFSNQMIETPGTNLSIGYVNATGAINTELQGLNSLQVMDKIIVAAGNLGLKVVLDNHRSEAGTSAEANGLWFTTSYPESAWIADWTMLAKRYQYNATVIGFDLRNEPHNATSGGACWDCGGANDWHLAAQRAGNAVLAANPSLLIFVEGTDTYNGDSYWWGGNLEGVAQSPVTLAVANHLVYSAHEYGPHEYAQKWFDANTSYATLSTVWNKHWAYISQNNLAPVWVAEFGTTNAASDVDSTVAGSQGQWFQSLVNFLNADPTLNWSYWAVNGEDAYALLDANYNTVPVSAVKQAKLATIQFALSKGITTGAAPAAPSNLTATAVSTSQISLAWTPSTTAGSYYTVSFGTIPGNTVTTLVSGVSTPAYQATGLNAATTYYFVVSTVSSGGTSAASNQATATTKSALTAPSAPTGVAAATVSTSQINVSWNAVAGTGVTYSVYSGTTAGGTALVASGLTTTAYASTGLSANTTYFYSVRAENAAGSSPASATVSAKSQDARASPPDAPTALTATSVSSTQINVGWTASAGTGVTYNVYAGTSTNTVTALLGSGVSGTSFAAAGLNPATTYFFDVVAVSSAGSSGVSAMVSATTQAAVATPPAAPTGLTAVPVSSYAIHLAWSASTSAANTPGLTYNVFGRTAASSTNSLLASNVTGTAFTVSGLTPGTVYSFYVVAVNGVLWSQPSNVVNAMTPGIVAPPSLPNPPTGLTAVAVSDTQINLAWQASTTTGVTYTVYQGAGAGAGAVAIASNVTSTSFAVSGLKASSTYFFVVQAVSAAGSSAASNEASAVTQAAAIACHVSYNVYTDWVTGFTTGISITNTSTGALTSWTLSWSFAGNQQVAQGWSGDFTQSGKNVTVHNASWNGDIAAGATLVGVGFNGSYNGSNPTPTAFSLNGVPCK